MPLAQQDIADFLRVDDLRGALALGDSDLQLDAVLGVVQRGVGEAGLHVVVQLVEARLEARGVRALLGGQHERPGAGDHAELCQPRAQAGRGVGRGEQVRSRRGVPAPE